MKKRLLSAAAFAALCALAGPANARSFDDGNSGSYAYAPAYESRSRSDYYYDRDADEDGERTHTRRGRSERATRHRPRSNAAHHAPREKAVTVRRVVTQPVVTQPLAAAPVGDITKPEVNPPAPTQQLAAVSPPPPAAMPDAKPLVPFVEPRQPPGKRPARDGRNCLRPAARALLERVEAQFGPMQIISTCRPGARIAGSGRISKHATGDAIDFNAGKRKAEVVRWLIANHRAGGTMTYAGMSHIHMDVGPRFVSLNSGGR